MTTKLDNLRRWERLALQAREAVDGIAITFRHEDDFLQFARGAADEALHRLARVLRDERVEEELLQGSPSKTWVDSTTEMWAKLPFVLAGSTLTEAVTTRDETNGRVIGVLFCIRNGKGPMMGPQYRRMLGYSLVDVSTQEKEIPVERAYVLAEARALRMAFPEVLGHVYLYGEEPHG